MPSAKLAILVALLAATTHAVPTAQSDNPSVRSTDVHTFHVPAGQADGVYTASIDKDGKHVHTKIADLAAPPQKWHDQWKTKSPRNVSRLEARKYESGTYCTDKGAVMDDSEVSRAAYNLGTACDSGGSKFIPARTSQYALSGSAIVFICNHAYAVNGWFTKDPRDKSCSTTEVINEVQWVENSNQCNHREGWSDHIALDEEYNYSYGYTKVGSGYC